MANPAEQTQFSHSLLQFSNDLYQKLAAKSTGDVIYSPYSMAVALALASQGAKGATFEEIRNGLHLSGDQAAVAEQFSTFQTELGKNVGQTTLNIANKVYVKSGYELQPAFSEVAVKKFNSDAESVDFADATPTAAKINGWVEDKTNKKIKNLIKPDSLDEDTRLVLVNAIYFKGNWRHQFKMEDTKKEPFWVSKDKSVEVDMMHLKEDFKYGIFDDLDCTALEMPYNDSNISMMIFLPNKRDGLKELEARMRNVNLADLTSHMYTSEVEVSLPRFRSEFEMEMKEPLKELGFTSMFENADFSNLLNSSKPLQVSSVIHKAFIEVNEEGAEAAAATGVQIMTLSMPMVEYFVADHPFLYVIAKKSSILFMGRRA